MGAWPPHQLEVQASATPPQAATTRPSTKTPQPRCLNATHQGPISSIAATDTRDTALDDLPPIFTFLEHRAGTSPCSSIKWLATLTIAERPTLVMCVENLDTYTRFLWGVEYVMPSFTRPNPEDGKFIAFARDTRKGQLPTTVEANPKRFQVDEKEVPLTENLTQALARTALVTPRIPEKTSTYDRIAPPPRLHRLPQTDTPPATLPVPIPY